MGRRFGWLQSVAGAAIRSTVGRVESALDGYVDTILEQYGTGQVRDYGSRSKQVILVPTYLNMQPGKVASQCCHAAVRLVRSGHNPDKRIILKVETVDELTALMDQAMTVGLLVFPIVDEGLTEVPTGSVTAVSIFGAEGVVDGVTGNLSLL